MKLKLNKILIPLFLMVFQFGFTQINVSGSVSGIDGGPLPGATVLEKGTQNAVITDFDGKFSIEASDEAILEISFVGYQTTEINASTDSLDIVLELGAALEEVIVTSLGISRDRKSLGYAVAAVDGDDVSAVKDANFLSSLQGKVAGLDIKSTGGFAGSANVIIRGHSSLYGNNQALFVVDGTPISNAIDNSNSTGRGGYDYGNGAMDINPDDIDKVSVLKGAAATALYGSRGSNGVIVITTKKGSSEDGFGVTVNSSYTVGSIDLETVPKYQNEYGAGYGAYYEGPDAGFFTYDVDQDGTADLTTAFTEDASFGARFNPSLQVYQWNSIWPELSTYKQASPYVAGKNTPVDLYQQATTLINSVSVQDGNENGSFRVGYTNLDMEGILPNSSMVRHTMSFNSSYNINDQLSASASVNVISNKATGRNGTGYDSRNLWQSHRQWFQMNVDPLEQMEAYKAHKKNMTWNAYSWDDPNPIYFDNIGWTLYENYSTDEKKRYFGNTNLSYAVNDWLNVLGTFSYDTSDSLIEERINVGSVDVSNYTRRNTSRSEYNYNIRLNVEKRFNEITLNGNLGFNLRETNFDRISASTNGGINIPGLYTLANTSNPLNPPSEYSYQKKVDGFYANASVGFNNTYYLEASVRRDRSSAMPISNNNYLYPSISGVILFHDLLNLDFLTFGKLRANYAEVGNDTSPYNVFSSYDLGIAFDGNATASNSYSFNNPDLKEERTKSYEVGVEASMLNNRLTVDLSYYNSQVNDLLTPVDISNSTGLGAKWLNAGTIENKGIELMLSGTPIKVNDFSWKLSFNYSKNENLVIELAEGLENLQLGSFQGGVSLNAIPGQPYGTIRGRDFVYNSQGEKIVEDNGSYGARYKNSPLSNEMIGDMNPDWKGGIRNSFTYKDLSLSFLIDIQSGGDLFSLDTYYGFGTGLYDRSAGLNELGNPKRDLVANGGGVLLPGVTESGAPNTQRSEAHNYRNPFGWKSLIQAMHVYDASYVKLRELKISYNVPESILSGNTIKSATFSIIGKNLWIIDKNLPYADPEAGLSAGNIQGYQSGAPAGVKEIGVNLNIKL